MTGSIDDPKSTPNSHRGLLVVILLAGLVVGAGGMWLAMHGGTNSSSAAAASAVKYTCPMHPTIVQDHPGDCPICGMKLVPMEKAEPTAANSSSAKKILFYRSPMDPKVTSPVPLKDEMGMDYVPVYEEETSGAVTDVPGRTAVTIDPARQQLIGLRTAAVTRGSISGGWTTVGRVQVDETRVSRINVKTSGYVEKIFVDYEGRPVKRGDPLFSVYSPDLLSAQQEYLLALKTKDELAKSGGLSENGAAMVAAARQKLKLWDVPDAEIKRLEQTGESNKAVTFVSPVTGVVTAKNVVEGSTLNPGDTPYEITDLSMVWIMADAYESDIIRAKVGMPATFTTPSLPGKSFEGRVDFVEPILKPETRTLDLHLHFMNPKEELKPGMFGEVEIQGTSHDALLIPADAVIPSGKSSFVFVALSAGKFEPRSVELGATSGDQIEVVSGVHEGESVVTKANFLIDSESSLRAALAAMTQS